MDEVIIDVLGITPALAGRARILGRDVSGNPRSLVVREGHLLLHLIQPGERWALFVAADGETVQGGSFRGEERGAA
jgi:hypothetical protein